MKFKNFLQNLNEKHNGNEYGCVYANVYIDNFKFLDKHILDGDYVKPKEKIAWDSHITLLYGVTVDVPNVVASAIGVLKPFQIKFGKVNIFTEASTEHDVIYIEVEKTPQLVHVNNFLKNNLVHVETYPDFKPHITLAYVKKGKYSNLIGNDEFEGLKYDVTHIVYSDKENNVSNFYLNYNLN